MKSFEKKIIVSELLTTDALINSIRMVFILSIVNDTAFVATLKAFMLSSILYFWNHSLPFAITIVLVFISIVLIISLPKEVKRLDYNAKEIKMMKI